MQAIRRETPLKLIQNIIRGHTGNILQGKHDGELGRKILNNKGVFQGSPINALLYINYADAVMV